MQHTQTWKPGETPQPENQKKRPKLFVKTLAAFVTIAGLIVMMGWILDIELLKRLSPAWVSMKFLTAIAFVLSGLTLYFLVLAKEGEWEVAQVALAIISLLLALLMGLLLFSALFGIQTGIETLFVKDADSLKSFAPGRPSVPTIINFILIAAAAIVTLINPEESLQKLKTIGMLVGAIGALAVTGYIFNAPMLYYYIADTNSAMALHTALLFVILGTGFVCL